MRVLISFVLFSTALIVLKNQANAAAIESRSLNAFENHLENVNLSYKKDILRSIELARKEQKILEFVSHSSANKDVWKLRKKNKLPRPFYNS